MAEKGGFKHFMLKEIHEQPRAIADTLRGRINLERGDVTCPELGSGEELAKISRIYIVACGTSWHAGLVGRYHFEDLAGLAPHVELASEFRYRNAPIDARTLVIAISQSGETADTLAAVREAKKKGARVLAASATSSARSIAREARRHALHPRRPRDRRRLDQGFHDPAGRAAPVGDPLRPPARGAPRRARRRARAARRRAAPLPGADRARARRRALELEAILSRRRRALARGGDCALPRAAARSSPSGPRRRAEAEGNQLHPRRGPGRRRDEARPDRAHRSPRPDGRPGTPGRPLRQGPLRTSPRKRCAAARSSLIATEGDSEGHALADHVLTSPRSARPARAADRRRCRCSCSRCSSGHTMADFKGTDVDQPRNLAKSVTVE